MYNTPKRIPTNLEQNNSVKGETIEKKIERIMEAKEPITDRAELIYTDRKEGVLPAYDIRTDRHVLGIEAMDIGTKSHLAKRELRHNPKKEETKTEQKIENENPEKGGKE